MGPRAETLLGVMSWIETFTIRPATTDLTDDEYFWEPAPGAWSVRVVDGLGVLDSDPDVVGLPPGSPGHPLTTIGWNLAHGCQPRVAGFDFLGGDVTAGDYEALPSAPVPLSAAEAVSGLRSGWDALRAALSMSSDEQLERPWTWFFGETNGWQHVGLVLNEVSHHAAQVCQLRDVRRRLIAS